MILRPENQCNDNYENVCYEEASHGEGCSIKINSILIISKPPREYTTSTEADRCNKAHNDWHPGG